MMKDPLLSHNRANVCEVKTANHHLAAHFGPHKLALKANHSQLHFCHRAANIGANTVNYLRYGAAVHIRPQPLKHFYLVTLPLSGHIDLTINGSSSARYEVGAPIIVNPEDRLTMYWTGTCATLTLRLCADYVRTRTQAYLPFPHAKQPHFSQVSQLGLHGNTRIAMLMRFIVDDIDFNARAGLGAHPTCAQAAIDEVISHLARFHSTSAQARLQTAHSPIVQRALKIIAADASELHSSKDVALRCKTSLRNLQACFRRDLGRTPTSILQETKLRSVHEYLQTRKKPASVTAAAMHAGWFQLDRLGSIYRSYFGELPKETLLRMQRTF